jgi:hypothetical protein
MKLKQHNKNNFYTTKRDIFKVIDATFKNSNDITIIIPNIMDINNQDNSKFSNILCERFPEVRMNLNLGSKQKLGTNQYVTLVTNEHKSQIICANMFCKQPKGKYNRMLDYGALCACMLHLRANAKNITSNSDKSVQIHSAKFGTGFAGGDWRTISNLVNDIWSRDFTCFIYEPTNV